MSVIDRYIFRTVLGTTLVVLLAMLVLDTFINLLAELEELGRGNYDLLKVIRYLLLTTPRRLYETTPVALLVGGLLGMGTLASNNELTVMRASGLSRLRLVVAALQAGLIFSLVIAALGEFVAPKTERMAQQLKIRAGVTDDRLSRGLWARDGNYIVHIGAALPGPKLVDITVYAMDDNFDLTAIVRAIEAEYHAEQWILKEVTHSAIQPERVTTTAAIPQIGWNSVLTPDTLSVLAVDPEDLAIRDLITYIDYLGSNGLNTRRYQLAFWTKVLAPLANLAMLFIAMPFAFAPQRSTGIGQRLVIGVLIGLLFFLLNRLLGNLVLLYGYQPLLGAGLPMLPFYVAGVIALQRLR